MASKTIIFLSEIHRDRVIGMDDHKSGISDLPDPIPYFTVAGIGNSVANRFPVQQFMYFIHRYVFWRHVDPPEVPRHEIVKHSEKSIAPKAEHDPTKRV